jgi:hypothetical protein
MLWTGSIRLRIRTIGGLLWTRWWTFGFLKMLGSSWEAAQLAASQEELCSVSNLLLLWLWWLLLLYVMEHFHTFWQVIMQVARILGRPLRERWFRVCFRCRQPWPKILTAPLQFLYIAVVTFYCVRCKDETYKLRHFICVKKTITL